MQTHYSLFSLMTLVIGSTTTELSFANDSRQTIEEDTHYELAIGLYTNVSESEYVGGKDSLDVMPLVEWSWENWFLQDYRLGSYLAGGDSWVIFSSLGLASFGDSERGASAVLADVKAPGDVYTVVLSSSLSGQWGHFEYAIEQDISNRHHSHFFRTRYGIDIPMDRWTLEPVIRLYYLPEKLVNFYYGVPEKRVKPGRSVYKPKDAYLVDTGVNLSYRLKPDHAVSVGLMHRFLSSEIRNSPIVNAGHNASLSASYLYAF